MDFRKEIETCRIGIILDDDLFKKLRKKQARMIEKTKKSVTLSSVIRDSLREELNKT